LIVGRYGDGELIIEDGGVVTNTEADLGLNEGGIGRVRVTGAGSQWNSSDILDIGFFGEGALDIEDGGTVNSPGAYISFIRDSTGAVNISGQGSVWENDNFLVVGHYGNGTMSIDHGGAVHSNGGSIGYYENGVGDVIVTGAGSAWLTENNTLSVGVYATGSMTVADGGYVHSYRGILGRSAGSTGTVTIMGADSRWDVIDTLIVGDNGTGTLTIDGGTVLGADDLVIASAIGSSGTLHLSGGKLELNGNKLIGGAGTAAFNFNGGTLKHVGTIDLNQPLVQQGGTLAPGGSIGQTNIIGDYVVQAGTVEIELGGAGNPHDLVTASGDIDIALLGTTLDLPGIGTMAAGTYTVIESTNGTLTGMFEQVTGIGLYAGLVDVLYDPTSVSIRLNWGFVPGDLDGDGFVGLDDLDVLLDAWNDAVTPGDLLAGDPSGDGFVGLDDLDWVLQNWNLGTPPGEQGQTIPEPGTWLLLGVGTLCGRGRGSD